MQNMQKRYKTCRKDTKHANSLLEIVRCIHYASVVVTRHAWATECIEYAKWAPRVTIPMRCTLAGSVWLDRPIVGHPICNPPVCELTVLAPGLVAPSHTRYDPPAVFVMLSRMKMHKMAILTWHAAGIERVHVLSIPPTHCLRWNIPPRCGVCPGIAREFPRLVGVKRHAIWIVHWKPVGQRCVECLGLVCGNDECLVLLLLAIPLGANHSLMSSAKTVDSIQYKERWLKMLTRIIRRSEKVLLWKGAALTRRLSE